MRRSGLTLVLLLTALLPGLPAAAQEAAGCQVAEEVIATLPPSRLGVPTVWDATYGQDKKMTQFQAGLPLEDGTVLAYGRALSAEDLKPETVFLAKINRRGRVLDEQSWPAKAGEVPVDLLPVQGGYLSVSNIRGGQGKAQSKVRLSWFNNKAEFRKDQIWEDAEFHLEAQSLTPAEKADGSFILVAHAISKGKQADQHAVLAHFSPAGQLVWKRAYRPGIPNQIYSVLPLKDGGYLALGRIRIDDGRKAGWLIKLGADGTVLWQRTFPRGKEAVLSKAVSLGALIMNEGGYVLLGQVEPLDDGLSATWVMQINAFGEVVWQRYLRRKDTGFKPAGLIRQEDGRLTVVVNAFSSEESGQRDHVRILTLAPEGPVIGDEAYIAGIEARATDVMPGWRDERIVLATILSDAVPLNIEMIGDRFVVAEPAPAEQALEDSEKPAEEAVAEEPVQEGWVFVATPLDPYEDPCQ